MKNLFEELLGMLEKGARKEQQFDGEDWGAPPPRERRKFKPGLLKYAALLLVAALVAYQGFYIVPAGSRGVVFRLGKVAGVADQGINFKLPVIDLVTIVNTEQIQRFEYGYRTVVQGPPPTFADRPDISGGCSGRAPPVSGGGE